MQPEKAGAFEGVIAFAGEFSGLIPSRVIDRFVQRL
jgi:hypothetical protein